MSKSARAAVLAKMTLHEEAFARGSTTLTIDLSQDSARPIIGHFLRAYRGRGDLEKLIPNGSGFTDELEQLRSLLLAGALDDAEKLAAGLEASDDLARGELELELMRLRRFQGKLDEALQLSARVLANPTLSEVSRMTCHQLRGSIFTEKKDFSNAVSELELAITLADVYSIARSAFSARAFMVQALAELGKGNEAQLMLRTLQSRLELIDQDELWLDRLILVIRAEAHYCRLTGDAGGWKKAALEAKALAEWVGDQNAVNKCELDLETNPAELTETPVHVFSGWLFIPSRNVVLNNFPREVIRFEDKPVAKKILHLLAGGPLSFDALFRQLYNLNFDPERHTSHMKSTLSNLRKFLPQGALRVVDGLVTLNVTRE